ncbi:hypothetical protein [Paludisphaera sp.]|uniref:hypothetical protein n=1 Tax=Paludisphaera sp. TaxID=2017432 RepID=UPI00301DB0DA
MPWRRLHPVRALSAAGLVSSLMFLSGPAAAGRHLDDEPSTLPASATTTETVDVLKAAEAGDLKVSARGQGQDKVRLSIENVSDKRLNVIIPPGLVAASALGQGGRGFQSMGLGAITNRPGSFGRFGGSAAPGFRSMPVTGSDFPALTVPAGETVDVSVPGVCLNYGVATPGPRDVFTLMDVDQYTEDARIRKALRSLAMLGTSQGVAQAAMWRICDGVSFEELASRDGKLLNDRELALAARFVDAVDSTGSDELVSPSMMAEGRVLVSVQAEGQAARAEAERLVGKLDGLRLFGLPIQVVEADETPAAVAPALLVKLALGETREGEAVGRMQVGATLAGDQWSPLGKATFRDRSSLAVLDAQSLVGLMEHELATTFITVKAAKRTTTSTTLRVDNRLPFTVAGLSLRAGASPGSPIVPFDAVGIGPARSAMLPIQAAQAEVVGVELNGL